MSFIVPDRCVPLLQQQRTDCKDVQAEYGEGIAQAFRSFRDYLPDDAEHIADIGSGMAGIDVLLGRHYPDATLHLLDKEGVSPHINAGFHRRAEDFAHYNDFDAALELLAANGVSGRVVCHDLSAMPFPEMEFDVVVSLLSWGFHYPICTYAPRCKGVMIVDVRKGTGGETDLRQYGCAHVVHEGKKFNRVVVRC